MCKDCAEVRYAEAAVRLKAMDKEESKKEDAWPHDCSTELLYSRIFKKSLPFKESDLSDERFRILKNMRLYELPPFCPHLQRQHPNVPPSHRVSVTAKLALPDDPDGRYDQHSQQLRNEGRNYRDFPSHMFEHWNGYNIVYPMKEPTPVGAVAPQFYGYYEPDDSNKATKAGRFMSSILLLEHCGLQIDVNQLCLDNK
jgi:hypothetical protein